MFLDHAPWERANDVTFVLEREGDLALLPCSAGRRAIDPSDASVHDALIALQEMIAEGWHVVGRLQTTFVGQEAEDHFWESTLKALGMNEATHPYASDLFWERVL